MACAMISLLKILMKFMTCLKVKNKDLVWIPTIFISVMKEMWLMQPWNSSMKHCNSQPNKTDICYSFTSKRNVQTEAETALALLAMTFMLLNNLVHILDMPVIL